MDPRRSEDHLLLQRGGDPAPRHHGGCDEAACREVEALSTQITYKHERRDSGSAGQRSQEAQFIQPFAPRCSQELPFYCRLSRGDHSASERISNYRPPPEALPTAHLAISTGE